MTEKLHLAWLDDDLIMISALEHWSYCHRQCALIHIEQTFDENLYTLRGRAVHKQVDEAESVVEDGVRVERAMPIWNRRLGLIGKADVVEFHADVPYPVEYKHGPRRQREHDDLQTVRPGHVLGRNDRPSRTTGGDFSSQVSSTPGNDPYTKLENASRRGRDGHSGSVG